MAGPGRPGPKGKIERARDLLDDNGRETLDMVIHDREWTDLDVAKALTALLAEVPGGDSIGPIHRVTIQEWRAGQPRGAKAGA